MKAENIKKVLVVGAGSMGEGISQVFAQAGINVLQVDTDKNAVERCRNQIRENAGLLKESGLLAEEASAVVSRIEFSVIADMASVYNLLEGIDFVVEAIPESLDLKRRLFGILDDCPHEIILSSNTSSLTITEIAEGLNRPDRVVGLHFLYPAHIVPLVEIHGGEKTSPEIINITKELMNLTGKQPIVLKKEIPGFVVNRIQAAYNREITYLLDQGVTTAEELDLAAKAGFGFRLACMGPLEMHDLNGLDVVMKAGAKTRQSICNDTGHSPSLIQKVENGELGVKTGKGWHDYKDRSRQEIIAESNKKLIQQLGLFKAFKKPLHQP